MRAQLKHAIETLIDTPAPTAERDALLQALSQWQREHVAPYARLTASETPPALPTDVFRFVRVAAHPPAQDTRTFHSSGTTASNRSHHHFRDLSLYDRAAKRAARHMLFPDHDRMPLIMLAPHESQLPSSSLSYMLSRFEHWFGTQCTWAWHQDRLDVDGFVRAVEHARIERTPVAILGTSFAFVHLLDALETRHFKLPAGSRIMHTGGYKGRSREIEPAYLRESLARAFHIPDAMIIAEYGMTELSSQLYETTLRASVLDEDPPTRRFWVPWWVRVTPVDPVTLQPARDGDVGLLRIDDCANLDSVCCIQTSDLGRCHPDGIELLGRASDAIARGCSLSADIALGRTPAP